MKHFYVTYLSPINYVILAYFVGLGVFYIALYVSAVFEMRQYLREVRAEKYRGILVVRNRSIDFHARSSAQRGNKHSRECPSAAHVGVPATRDCGRGRRLDR